MNTHIGNVHEPAWNKLSMDDGDFPHPEKLNFWVHYAPYVILLKAEGGSFGDIVEKRAVIQKI